MSESNLDGRIGARAHQLWIDAGQPEGQETDYWEEARILIAVESDRTSLKPINQATSEPIHLQDNLGELPGALTDQGDRAQVSLEDITKPDVHETAAKSRRPF